MNDRKAGSLSTNKYLLAVAGLALLVLAVYFQTTGFGFINLDDNLYVYDNTAIKNGLTWEFVKWAFTTYWSANWHPLTWLSHGLDVQLFQMNSGMHHSVNVVFHLINSLLAFAVFWKMTGRKWESLIVAAIFAVHPTHVESVAWISERKDVLSTMFWLLTMLAYLKYAKERSEHTPVNAHSRLLSPSYFAVFVLLGLGLMAKPMLVTLPFVLLLCDYWPLNRLQSKNDLVPLVTEKLPLIALSAASSIVTFIAQRSLGAVESLEFLSVSTRFMNAAVSYAKYILMFFYPADLAIWYPYEKGFPLWQIGTALILLAGLTALALWQARRRPFLIVGWLWFIGTLVPVIGIVQVGSQALADRYTYVPYFGLSLMVVWGASSLAEHSGFGRYAFDAAAIVAILVLGLFAGWQTALWRDNESLYRHTLAVTSNNYLIAHNLCHHYLMLERLDDAEPLCRQAIEIKPDYYEPHNTLGIILFKRGKYADAEQSFIESLKYSPNYVYAFANIAQTQSREGKPEEAEESLRRAVEASGGSVSDVFADALSDIATAFAEQRNWEKSAENLRRLIYLRPESAVAHSRLALTLYYSKQYDEAEMEAHKAIDIDENTVEAWNTLGLALLAKTQYDDAAKAFEKVLQLKSDYPLANNNLERARQHK
jgi:Flp pilus assembly protein TadD